MNKAQLIIDMPETCVDCYFYQAGEPSWCDLYVTNYRDIENENIRQEWCPLKPLPQKKDITLAEKREGYYELYTKNYVQGWNDCISEIIGEKNE